MRSPERRVAAAGTADLARGLTSAGVRALVLAGGLGTRLRSVTRDRMPKPMVEVAGRPFLEYLLLQLARAGIEDVRLLTGHGAGSIHAHVGDGRRWGLRVTYSDEERPLGTAGALRAGIASLEGDRFLVMNGDSFVAMPLGRLVERHADGRRRSDVLATLTLVEVEDAGRFGSVDVSDGAVVGFREKDPRGGAGLISAGVYVIERRLLEDVPPGQPASLERDVWPRHLDGRLQAHIVDASFSDMGEPTSLERLRAAPGPLLAAAGIGA